MTIEQCKFVDNLSGGISLLNGDQIVRDCIFENNSTDSDGGIVVSLNTVARLLCNKTR